MVEETEKAVKPAHIKTIAISPKTYDRMNNLKHELRLKSFGELMERLANEYESNRK